MYDLANGIYSHDEMLKAFKDNREISFEYGLLDKGERPLGIITASGSVDFNSSASIQRSASLVINEERDIDFLSERVRISMGIKIAGKVFKYPLGIFLLSSPSRQSGSGAIRRAVDCYDKTQILSDDRFTARYRVAAGSTYVSAVTTILQSTGFNDSLIDQSAKTVAADIEFPAGTSKLEAINTLLDAVNYNHIYADASGRFVAKAYVQPENRLAEMAYVTDQNSIVRDGASESLDVFNIPNQIVRYLESADRPLLTSTATNTDPTSKLSTVSRGRTIVSVEAVNDIADQATLDAYVARLLAETKTYQTLSFSTALMPHHECLDCLYVINKDLDVSGKYIETSWHMDLSVGGTMNHTCKKAVSI